jgi:cytochrome c-type biogenesis protein
MSLYLRLPSLPIILGVLVLAVSLAGCVSEPAPEEAAALTATAASYLVPTATSAPRPAATDTPVPRPTPAMTPVAATATDAVPTVVQEGFPAPDFAVADATGRLLRLSSLRGQPVAVVFWASWCGHCQNELPRLQTMYETYGDEGLIILGVSVPGLGGETQDKALAYAESAGLTFPIVFDREGQVYNEYGVQGVPNLFFIDRQGILVTHHVGEMQMEALEQQIRELVEEG